MTVVLGIDPARTSGWCLMLARERLASRIASGTADSAVERAEVVARALAAVEHSPGDRLVVVYEHHTVGGGARWTPTTMLGMGEARGRWMEALELAGVPRSHLVGVTPATWRKATLPRGTARDREALKAAAVASCRARGWPVASDDEAEACLIAWWGAVGSAEVAKLAARKRRAA